jgi:hypothetical protein
MFDLTHNVKRAILVLALVTVIASAWAHDGKMECYVAHLTPDGRAYMTPKPCPVVPKVTPKAQPMPQPAPKSVPLARS